MLMWDAVLPLSLSSLAARHFSFVRRGTEGLTESGAEVNGAGGDDVENRKDVIKTSTSDSQNQTSPKLRLLRSTLRRR